MNPTITTDLNLRLSAGVTFAFTVNVTDADGLAVNLTGASAMLVITQGAVERLALTTGEAETRLTISDAANGVLSINLPAATTAAWRGDMSVRLDLIQGVTVSRLLRGIWTYTEL